MPNRELNFYKNLLLEESRKHGVHSPMTATPKNSYDLVLENCYLGDGKIAQDKVELKNLGITHVLNASKGEKFSQVNTNQAFYQPLNIRFLGLNLMDVHTAKISKHFNESADYIAEVLDKQNGKLLVHCFLGMSRSASLIAAYLIKYRKLTLEQSIKLLSKNRFIWPNDGFIEQLIEWEKTHLNK